MSERTTWDGMPVASRPPFGASVVVYRSVESEDPLARVEFLLLHRSYNGADYHGEWAWTPPSGARYPGEQVEACARRELEEETGLSLALLPLESASSDWALYLARAERDHRPHLSLEHDRCRWAALPLALELCFPLVVADQLLQAAHFLGVPAARRASPGMLAADLPPLAVPGSAFEAESGFTFRVLEEWEFERALRFYLRSGYDAQLDPQNEFIAAELDGEPVGLLRLCLEEGVLVLRGMRIADQYQRRGIGTRLLHFAAQQIADRPCWCIPFRHLVGFYGQTGFREIEPPNAPPFLRERLEIYREKLGLDAVIMLRAETPHENHF